MRWLLVNDASKVATGVGSRLQGGSGLGYDINGDPATKQDQFVSAAMLGMAVIPGEDINAEAGRVAGSLSDIFTENATRGFNSFDALKTFLGSPGEGNVWHYIVEQSKIDQFGAQTIHNVDNVISISAELNSQLNNFYQTRNPLTGGLSPREWLKGKSLQQNYDFGRVALYYVSTGVW